MLPPPYLDAWIMFVIYIVAIPVGIYAFVHALLQRPEAYNVAGRLSKPAWLGITAGGTAALMLFRFGSGGSMFWIAGLVAVLVYIVDMRPKLIDAQRGPRW